ncbi:MAG: glycosyltransferase family 1 protein [Patescibacteria group bacterium]
MRIAIDTTPLESGHKDRGVGMYTKLLIEALQKYEGNHSYHFFTRGQKVPKNVDIVHYPYFDPFFITLPVFPSTPRVVTVHDLIPLVFPEHFPAGIRGRLKWQVQRWSLGRTTRIITDSESSKRDIIRLAGISPQSIDVVPLAAAPAFRQISDKEVLKKVKKNYDLPEKFVLYVGDINWNKNILGMITAFERVRRSPRFRSGESGQAGSVKLVLVGSAFLDASLREVQEINASIRAKKMEQDVVRIGSLVLEDLVAIYNLASVYIQPSFYEGFGLPVLEAMSCGTVVVTTGGGSLVEIAGPAAVVEPYNPDDIARGLIDALTMSVRDRKDSIGKQSVWGQQFSWQRAACETIASYKHALA